MQTRIKSINRNIIEWAILRSGNSLEAFYEKEPDVALWVEGEKFPTVKQLESFTHKVHVPFGYMFLSEPPEEEIPLPFFRTGKREAVDKVSLNVYHSIQIIQERQTWLTEYLEDLDFPDLDFVGKFTTDDDYKDIVRDIRKTLEIDEDWAAHLDNWEQALNYLTEKIEEAGIIVTFNGVVGSNPHRVIEVEDCRGFVLVNKKAPFLFVNARDAKAAQLFTLIHELAHVWLGESAGFDNVNLLPADDPVEQLCDAVAAEFLVPEDYFREQWQTNEDFKYLSRNFKVSPIVIARRALDLGLISREHFFGFYNHYMSEFYKKKDESGSGGNFYNTAKKRVSLRFAAFVNNAVNDNKLLYRDAYRLTNMKGNTYEKFITEFLY